MSLYPELHFEPAEPILGQMYKNINTNGVYVFTTEGWKRVRTQDDIIADLKQHIKDSHDLMFGLIKDHSNRGAQRMIISHIQQGNELLEES